MFSVSDDSILDGIWWTLLISCETDRWYLPAFHQHFYRNINNSGLWLVTPASSFCIHLHTFVYFGCIAEYVCIHMHWAFENVDAYVCLYIDLYIRGDHWHLTVYIHKTACVFWTLQSFCVKSHLHVSSSKGTILGGTYMLYIYICIHTHVYTLALVCVCACVHMRVYVKRTKMPWLCFENFVFTEDSIESISD